MSCSRPTCWAVAACTSANRARAPTSRIDKISRRDALIIGDPSGSFVFDLQPVWPDIDLQPLRLLLVLVEIVAEHGDRHEQCADDQKQNIAIAGHLASPLSACIQHARQMAARNGDCIDAVPILKAAQAPCKVLQSMI